MLVTAALVLSAAMVVRAGAHALILRGLRAPRLGHQRSPADLGCSDRGSPFGRQ